jgi:transposase
LRRRRKGGTQNQALGRSRGGFSTKIHARTNAEGLPIALLLTPGEAHDSTAFSDLMEDHDADPDVMLADRSYDSDAIRDEVRAWRRARNPHQEEPTCPALGQSTPLCHTQQDRTLLQSAEKQPPGGDPLRPCSKQLSRLRKVRLNQAVD